jgi:hypothetical protein
MIQKKSPVFFKWRLLTQKIGTSVGTSVGTSAIHNHPITENVLERARDDLPKSDF